MTHDPKNQALGQFFERKKYSSMIQKMDFNGAHAAEPSYHYCSECGTPVEVLTQKPVFPTYEICSQCRILVQNGWMKEAIQYSNERLS